uniref:Uncharacterized protein n=1 Tax=Acrobeloides nanus TaxID=290746 RepID=A0A914CLD1_9BILA
MTAIINKIVPISLNDRNLRISLLDCHVRFILSKLRENQNDFYVMEFMRRGDDKLEDLCTYIKITPRDFEELESRFRLPVKFDELGSFMADYLSNIEDNPNEYIQGNCIGEICNVNFKGSNWNLSLDFFRFKKIDLTCYLVELIHELRKDKECLIEVINSTAEKQASKSAETNDTEVQELSLDHKTDIQEIEVKNEFAKKLEDLQTEFTEKLHARDEEISELKSKYDQVQQDNEKLREDLKHTQASKLDSTKAEDSLIDDKFMPTTMQADVEQLNSRIKDLNNKVKELEAELERNKPLEFSTQFLPGDIDGHGKNRESVNGHRDDISRDRDSRKFGCRNFEERRNFERSNRNYGGKTYENSGNFSFRGSNGNRQYDERREDDRTSERSESRGRRGNFSNSSHGGFNTVENRSRRGGRGSFNNSSRSSFDTSVSQQEDVFQGSITNGVIDVPIQESSAADNTDTVGMDGQW